MTLLQIAALWTYCHATICICYTSITHSSYYRKGKLELRPSKFQFFCLLGKFPSPLCVLAGEWTGLSSYVLPIHYHYWHSCSPYFGLRCYRYSVFQTSVRDKILLKRQSKLYGCMKIISSPVSFTRGRTCIWSSRLQKANKAVLEPRVSPVKAITLRELNFDLKTLTLSTQFPTWLPCTK